MPSTVISRFTYAASTRALEIVFTSGRRYCYFEVPEGVAAGLAQSFSKGRFFNARIRDAYRCAELEPEDGREPRTVPR